MLCQIHIEALILSESSVENNVTRLMPISGIISIQEWTLNTLYSQHYIPSPTFPSRRKVVHMEKSKFISLMIGTIPGGMPLELPLEHGWPNHFWNVTWTPQTGLLAQNLHIRGKFGESTPARARLAKPKYILPFLAWSQLTWSARSIEESIWKTTYPSFPRTLLIEMYLPSIPTRADSKSSITKSSCISIRAVTMNKVVKQRGWLRKLQQFSISNWKYRC